MSVEYVTNLYRLLTEIKEELMKRIGFFVICFVVIASAQAESYKCKQENGKYLFSDTPCVTAKQILEKTRIDYNGVVVNLSVNPDARPLPNIIVDHFLNEVDAACQEKDGQKILTFFSTEAQEKIKSNVINNNVFSAVSYVCKNIANIKDEVKKSKEPVLFASKKPYKSIELCLYTANKGLEGCLGNMKIVAENGDLKLDAL